MSTLRTYVKSAGILTVQSMVQRLLGIFASVILVRLLGSQGFGILSAMLNTANLGGGLTRLGADGAVHVHMAEKAALQGATKGQILSAGFIILAGSGMIGSILCFAFAQWIAQRLFQRTDLTVWLRFSAVLVFCQSVSQFCYAALAGLNEFKRYAVVMIASSFLNLAAGGLGAYFGYLRGAVVAATIVSVSTTALLLFTLVRTAREHQIHFVFDGAHSAAFRILKLGLPFYLSGVVAFPVSYYLQAYLSRNHGIENLAYLRIIAALTSLIVFIPTSVAAATITTLTEVRSDPSAASSKFFVFALFNIKFIWLFCLVTAIAVGMIMPLLIPLLFGSPYLTALPAARVALFSSVLLAVMPAASNVYFSARRVGLILCQTLIFCFVQGLLGMSLIPTWGLLGYVTAEFGGYFVVGLLILALMFNEGKKIEVSTVPALVLFVLTLFSLISTVLMTRFIHNQAIISLGGAVLLLFLLFVGHKFLLDATEHNRLNGLLLGLWKKVTV
jgi:O-antigen/teichoic acid export membrane protein